MKRLHVAFVGSWLLFVCTACTFDPDLGEPKCQADEECPPGCSCLDHKVCVPDVKGERCEAECSRDQDCQPSQADARCQRRRCIIVDCHADFADCNEDPADGCEADTRTDADHCGACDRGCAEHQHCSAAECQCDDGFADCNQRPSDGCEADLQAVESCGECGIRCGANQICAADGCRCDSGWADCIEDPHHDCETNTAGDVTNCGECARACTNEHGQTACVKGECQHTCSPNWSNCDGVLTNGCETDLLADDHNCFSCGQTCTEGKHCVRGECSREGVFCLHELCLTGRFCCHSPTSDDLACVDEAVWESCLGLRASCDDPTDCTGTELCCLRLDPDRAIVCNEPNECPGPFVCSNSSDCPEGDLCCPLDSSLHVKVCQRGPCSPG